MYVKCAVCVVAVFSAVQTFAASIADDCKSASDDCVAIGGWNFSVALGAGVRTNPLVNGTDLPLVVVPQFSYYGKRFFLDDLDLGFTLADTGGSTFNLVGSPGYDRVYFYRSDLQNILVSGFPGTGTANMGTPGAVPFPPRARRITYLAGPEWTFKYGEVTGQLDVLHEITAQDHGTEVRTAVSVPLMKTVGTLSATLGLTWKSAAIVNYYYGAPGIYEGGSALDPFFKVGYTLPLAKKWRFDAFAEYDQLGRAIADSPIVAEHYVGTVFIGAIYTF
jgi:MipA family protein